MNANRHANYYLYEFLFAFIGGDSRLNMNRVAKSLTCGFVDGFTESRMRVDRRLNVFVGRFHVDREPQLRKSWRRFTLPHAGRLERFARKNQDPVSDKEADLLSPAKYWMSFSLFCLFLILTCVVSQAAESNPNGWTQPVVTEIASGIWRVRFGTPERFTPDAIREKQPDIAGIARLPLSTNLPFKPEDISCRVTGMRTVVYVPCDEPEDEIYGFGLDPGAYAQKGLRKWLAVCAGVMGKTGASHAPVPFWLSTKGYGVYVDTAHTATVHVARLSPKEQMGEKTVAASEQSEVKTSTADLYAARKAVGKTSVVVDIPGDTTGVDVYVFAGPTMRWSGTICFLVAVAYLPCGGLACGTVTSAVRIRKQ
jgi:hypothetical protein